MIYILLIYFLLLAGYAIFSIAAIYHLNRFGYVGDLTKPVIILYSILSISVIIISLVLIALRDWPLDFNL